MKCVVAVVASEWRSRKGALIAHTSASKTLESFFSMSEEHPSIISSSLRQPRGGVGVGSRRGARAWWCHAESVEAAFLFFR